MDDIEIIVTNYPNEYVIKYLYGDHSTITSIYPDGVDTANYKVSKNYFFNTFSFDLKILFK